MQLIYRGLTYDYKPGRQVSRHLFQQVHRSEAHTLRYRGLTYHIDSNTILSETAKQNAKAAPQPIEYELTYRGLTYRVTRDEQGKVAAITSGANPAKK
jgi:Domain of unknown function (DUF4278)